MSARPPTDADDDWADPDDVNGNVLPAPEAEPEQAAGLAPGDGSVPARFRPGSGPPQVFADLHPDTLLTALEDTGLRCSGSLQALNSFENRVYLVGVEDDEPVVVKFYRPGRWSDAQIAEEHAFALELAADEVPVVAPMRQPDGSTLLHAQGHRLAIYRRQRGRPPELDNRIDGPALRDRTGQFLARLHRTGARATFVHRPAISLDDFGFRAVATILESDEVPEDVRPAWVAVAELCLAALRDRAPLWSACTTNLRLHGDCHVGNLLWAQGPWFVDLDDCRSGPAIQDLWMLADASGQPGADQSVALADATPALPARSALDELIAGYEKVRRLDPRERGLVEDLRTLRMLHYSAWLVERRDDPAFQSAFPWFRTQRYWQDQVLYLREQAGLLGSLG